MQDHKDGHDERDNVHERSRALEDDGIGELNIASKAFGIDAMAATKGGIGAYDGAKRDRCARAQVTEVAEAHGDEWA